LRPYWATSVPAQLNYGGIFDFDVKSEKLDQVNGELEDPTVWDDQKRAQDLGKEKKSLENVVHTLIKIDSELTDARDLFEMAREEKDEDTLEAIEGDAAGLAKLVEEMEFRRFQDRDHGAIRW
jgi:peptide chain release factor 2